MNLRFPAAQILRQGAQGMDTGVQSHCRVRGDVKGGLSPEDSERARVARPSDKGRWVWKTGLGRPPLERLRKKHFSQDSRDLENNQRKALFVRNHCEQPTLPGLSSLTYVPLLPSAGPPFSRWTVTPISLGGPSPPFLQVDRHPHFQCLPWLLPSLYPGWHHGRLGEVI